MCLLYRIWVHLFIKRFLTARSAAVLYVIFFSCCSSCWLFLPHFISCSNYMTSYFDPQSSEKCAKSLSSVFSNLRNTRTQKWNIALQKMVQMKYGFIQREIYRIYKIEGQGYSIAFVFQIFIAEFFGSVGFGTHWFPLTCCQLTDLFQCLLVNLILFLF